MRTLGFFVRPLVVKDRARRSLQAPIESSGLAFADGWKSEAERWWRRRELNPRPKMLSAKRLHT